MSEKRLLDTLLREFWQSERAVRGHSAVEADRLGAVPPAVTLRIVAGDAAAALHELAPLCRQLGLPSAAKGLSVSRVLSFMRSAVGDRLLDKERSYRGTLLAMRHGVDLVRLLRSAARADRYRELAAWCDAWLARREPQVSDVAQQLSWFGRHSGLALAPAHTPLWLRHAKQFAASLAPKAQRLRRTQQVRDA